MKMMMFFSFLMLVSSQVFANFEFAPITAFLTTKGKTSHHIAQVTNRSDEQVPVIIKVTERVQKEDGSEERPDTQDILVFPAQFVLGPKETKLVKVSWQGAEELPFERTYRIIAEQVPVDLAPKTKNQGSIKILINYVGTIYVNSKKTEPNVRLESLVLSQDGKKILLGFNNEGDAHSILKGPVLEVTGKAKGNKAEKKITFKGEAISAVDGKNVLAHSKLLIPIVKPPMLDGYDEFEWEFSYEK